MTYGRHLTRRHGVGRPAWRVPLPSSTTFPTAHDQAASVARAGDGDLRVRRARRRASSPASGRSTGGTWLSSASATFSCPSPSYSEGHARQRTSALWGQQLDRKSVV